LVINLHRRALGRAGPGTFVLIQKYPKNQVSREASLRSTSPDAHRSAFALQNGQNHVLQLFCPASRTIPNASAKTCYAPSTAPPIIVLPIFARSLPADGNFFYHVMGSVNQGR